MQQVWAIVTGEYEDREFGPLFTTPELAEQHLQQLLHSVGVIEQMAVLDHVPTRIKLHSWQAMKIRATGELVNEHRNVGEWWDYDAPEQGVTDFWGHNEKTVSVCVHHPDPVEAERIGREALSREAP